MHNIVIKENYGLEGFPVNPLIKKWEKKYPMDDRCKELEKQKIENLSCLNCGKCPKGVDFKVPKEDLLIFRKYLKECRDYFKIHNPYKRKVLKYDSRSME